MSNSRALFEKWAIQAGHGSYLKGYDKKLGYAFMELQTAWQAWQAATLAERERCAKIAENTKAG